LKISREVKAAIFVIFCAFILVFGYSFLKGTSLFKNEKVLHSVYSEVGGLSKGATVTINGMTIGKVTGIDFNDNYQGIKVSYTVPKNLNLSKKSKAILYEVGVIGGKAISIQPIFSNSSIVNDGDVLESSIKPGLTELINQQIAPIQSKIEGILTGVDSVFSGVNNILNYETQDNLKKSLENFSLSIENINELTNSAKEIILQNKMSINSSLRNINKTSENLIQITDSILLSQIKPMINNFEVVGKKLNLTLEKIEKNKGSLGKLINDDALYNSLISSSEELETLIKDLKANPKKYVHFSVFGRKNNKQK
jgi:phospholipid/cholesterol/gamma-HCH transport system substrate-binding protein